ncbi:MAG: threonine synthase [Rickettsiales bacterium]|nr:threonine synthase [Rickettsiales bacterium]
MTLHYVSTRGKAPALAFDEVVLAGLASDGGLYVPNDIPIFSTAEIADLAALSYPELAYRIIARFTGDSIEPEALQHIIAESYSTFRHDAIAPLKQLDAHSFVLELFHGPTLAFKDFALQFLGRLLDYILSKKQQKVVVIGATSGDTGSAAIAGCRGRNNMDIVILHPKDRVSDVQRRQMTTIADANVHNIAIDGTFDDCQDIVKTLFGDAAFREATHLTAVNSINWARILAQVVYYFYAALALGAPARRVSFSVPTGNFGDIYAGYIAKCMGLPIHQLIIATNKNDILARCVDSGSYTMRGVHPTLSPSMDIQISSNFERLLFDLHDRDGDMIARLMTGLRQEKTLSLSKTVQDKLRAEFASSAVDDEQTIATIRDVYQRTGELLDPHTAVGYAAGMHCRSDTATALVLLATAHPAKFPDAVKKATGIHPGLPVHLSNLLNLPERVHGLGNDVYAVKRYIQSLV